MVGPDEAPEPPPGGGGGSINGINHTKDQLLDAVPIIGDHRNTNSQPVKWAPIRKMGTNNLSNLLAIFK